MMFIWMMAAFAELVSSSVAQGEQGPPAVLALGEGAHTHTKNLLEVLFPDLHLPELSGIEFPVRLTNTSNHMLYYIGPVPGKANTSLSLRVASSEKWQASRPFHGCHVGMMFRQLAPGQTISFKDCIDGRLAGQEIRLEVALYTVKNDDHPAMAVTSGVTVFR
jgi:hypothetical protein